MRLGVISIIFKKIAMGFAIAVASWSVLAAQSTPPSPETKSLEAEETVFSPPTLDQVKTIRSEAEAAMDLNEPDKKSVLSLLDQGIRFLEETERLTSDTLKLTEKVKNAPTRIQEIETLLSRDLPPPDQIIDTAEASRMTDGELEQREREQRASLATLRESLNNVQDQIEVLETRPVQLQKESTDAMRRLQEVRKGLKADSNGSNEPRLLVEARKTKLLAEHAMLRAQIQSFEQQLSNHKVLAALLSAERDLADFEVTRNEARAQAWQAISQRRRQQEAIQTRMDAEVAKNLAPDLPPVIKEQYEINITLGRDLEELTTTEARTARELDQRQSELKTLEAEFAQIRQRIQGLSLSETIGLTLRQRRRELPGPEMYRRSSAQRQLIIGQVGEAQFIIDEKQLELKDIQAEIERILQSLPPATAEQLAGMEDRVRTLLTDRRDLLDKLENSYRRYYQNLQSLEFTEQGLSTLIDEYADFLDGRLLWMRTSKIFGPVDLRSLPAAFAWMVSPDNWWGLVRDLFTSFDRTPIIWIFGFLLAGILFIGRHRVKHMLQQLSKNVGRVRKDSFKLTVQALGLTLYLASSWPFLLVFTGWRLADLPFASDFGRAAGFGMLIAGHIWGVFNFLKHLCREKGLAQVHFRWQNPTRLTLQKQILWARPLAVFLTFAIGTIEAANKLAYGNSLGRPGLYGSHDRFDRVFRQDASNFAGQIRRSSKRRQTRPVDQTAIFLVSHIDCLAWSSVSVDSHGLLLHRAEVELAISQYRAPDICPGPGK